MLLKLLMSLPRPFVLLGMLLCVQFGLLKMPLASAFAILDLLDGLVGIDLTFHIVRARFRMVRRYLAYCFAEEPRIFRILDLISRGAQGHGPVHLR